MSSTQKAGCLTAWILNPTMKRILFLCLFTAMVKYAIYDVTFMLKNGFTKKTVLEVPRVTPIYLEINTTKSVMEIPHKKDNMSDKNEDTREKELKELISKNELAKKNKGVYLSLSQERKSEIEQINKDRKERVNDVCAGKKLRQNITLESVKKIKKYTNVAVDDKHKLLYCYIPKVGCTSWKVKLSLMSGKAGGAVLNTHPSPVDTRGGLAKYGIKMLSTYTPQQIKYRLENYFKFIFVRHPMERIVSSYRSKFEKREDNKVEYPWFYSTYGKSIRNAVRKDKTDKSDITFEEFVKYVILRSGSPGLTDDHWEQYNKICHLCLIDYDFIGKFDEGMIDDISYTLRQISPDETNYWFPNVTTPRSASALLRKYFGKIPTSLVDGLEEGYSLDFELFNFDKGLSSKLNTTL